MDAGKRTACSAGTDRLTSTSVRLLTDTKETVAHSPSHTHRTRWDVNLSGVVSVALPPFQVEAAQLLFYFFLSFFSRASPAAVVCHA